MARWNLFSRTESYELSGGLHLSSAKSVVRHLGVDTAVVETPFSPAAYARTAPGCGIVLHRDGHEEFNGLVGSERTMGWDAVTGQATIKVTCVGDNVHLADRIAFPDPNRAGNDQITQNYWRRTLVASTAMWALINENAGPAALPARRVPTLYMGTDPGAGVTRLWEALFNPVIGALSEWSMLSGADLGVRIRTTSTGLRCDIYTPRQLAGDIRFSADLGNLHGFSYAEIAPDCTYALVAGQGDLAARVRREAISTNPLDTRWGRRIEKYIDRRDEADPTLLGQAAADAITEGQGQVALTCTLSDSQAATYGQDWGLGDRVSVYAGLPGQPKAAVVVDLVREISFEVDNTGAEKIRPAVGGVDAKAVRPGPTQQALAQVGRRLEGLIRRK